MPNPGWIQITPFFGVAKIEPALAFYRYVLGFSVWHPGGGYAYAERDLIGIRLIELDNDALNPPGCSHAYCDVRDVENLFAELKDRLLPLSAQSWGRPKDHAYGQREFWVRDPDGNLITFGQGVGENAGQWDYRDEP